MGIWWERTPIQHEQLGWRLELQVILIKWSLNWCDIFDLGLSLAWVCEKCFDLVWFGLVYEFDSIRLFCQLQCRHCLSSSICLRADGGWVVVCWWEFFSPQFASDVEQRFLRCCWTILYHQCRNILRAKMRWPSQNPNDGYVLRHHFHRRNNVTKRSQKAMSDKQPTKNKKSQPTTAGGRRESQHATANHQPPPTAP